ncbi:MAG: AMP-binding protein [Flavobacteriales bacterium]|nr:AMP-binding protein [Flavobacteriales bacterium]
MRDELKLVQFATEEERDTGRLQRMQEHLARLEQRSPYYQRRLREARLKASDLGQLSDLERFPLTANEDLQSHGQEMLCIPKRSIIDHVTTSGTTGEPVSLYQSEADLERLAANEHNSLLMIGATADDVVQLMTTMDRRFMAGLAYFLGARSLGAGVVRMGPGAAALQWESMHRFESTLLITVPSFLLRLLDQADELGIDPSATNVRAALCIGEPLCQDDGGPSHVMRKIKERWDIRLLGTYASTEMATACTEEHEGSGYRVQDQLVHIEVLDADGRHVKDGEVGEVVATPLHTEAMPLLRYRTGDLCRFHASPLTGHPTGFGMWLGPVLGRQRQRLKVKGTTVYPAQVIEAVSAYPGITNFVVLSMRDELGGDALEVRVNVPEAARVREHLQDLLRVAPEVRHATDAAIDALKWPKGSRKPRLFVDQR